MGKKNKHSKDKLHKTVSELTSHHVGANRDLELSVLHRRLKFDSCCLSLNTISGKPFGLCDDDNYCYVFEFDLIVKFLEKYQYHPITGNKVTANKLIELNFHKNNEDQYHCPVIFKLFNQRSKIVANRKTGHVYSHEAYHQLNLKANNFKDLLTDEAFEKDDIVTIQDPEKAEEKWNVSNFYYVKNKVKLDEDASESNIRNLDQSSTLKSSLEEYNKQAETIVENFNKIVGQNVDSNNESVKLDKINSAPHSDGAVARSVTSTVEPVTCVQNAALLSNEQILYPRIKKKGYLQLVTNKGPINLELFCDRTPKTCHNFLLLATRGYYDNTCFHRLVKNFILQGGDPTGTGTGGQSAWGQPFKDECRGDLKHVGRGVLAMANSGPDTNKSQFYITLRGEWEHLDGKHTVFGRVVGGEDTLDRLESVEVDKKGKPKEEIKILRVVKYVDPFEEAEKAIEEDRKRDADLKKRPNAKLLPNGTQPMKKFRSNVGIYIDLSSMQKVPKQLAETPTANIPRDVPEQPTTESQLANTDEAVVNTTSLASKLATLSNASKKSGIKSSYGDFSGW